MTPQRFKEIRLLLGLTIAEMAEKLTCNPRTVRRYEQSPDQKGHRAVHKRVAEDMEKWVKKKENKS